MNDNRPRIIIRRKRAVVSSYYSGAWKIALADFMTALMALFLVLWVLSTASPAQMRGLADYFSTPLAEAISGGDRTTSSDSAIPGGGPDPAYREGERANVHLRPQPRPSDQRRRLRHLRDSIEATIQSNGHLRSFRDQMRMDMTPEGLRIQLVDNDRRPMFELGSAKLAPYTRDLLDVIAPLLNELPNRLSILGHTDDLRYSTGDQGYSNWELSSDRANASRRELVAAGFDSDKLLRVSGVADRVPLAGSRPGDPSNRRIELMVLTPEAVRRMHRGLSAMGQSDRVGMVDTPHTGITTAGGANTGTTAVGVANVSIAKADTANRGAVAVAATNKGD